MLKVASWISTGKEVVSWLPDCVVIVPFPYGVCGRMWNSIVSVPDHCLFIYYKKYGIIIE